MTAREAAKRMGIRVETLYAYVSRGLLASHPAPDGRTSLFDATEVEELARRGRPRQSSRSTSLTMLIETSLTSLSERGTRYRGHPVAELARTYAFEQVAGLLWTGQPTPYAPWVGERLPLPPGEAVAGLRVAVATLMTGPPPDGGTSAVGSRLIATMVDSLPAASGLPTPRLRLPDGRGPLAGSIAGRLWTRLSPRRPTAGTVAVLNAALVLMADHDMAASTFGARVAASTRADLHAVALAGLSVLSGPLHGGASRGARALLLSADRVGPARAVSEVARTGGRFHGFGHSVYVGVDPRATVLLDLLRDAGADPRLLTTVGHLQREVRERAGQEANVDLALAALSIAGRLPEDGGEVITGVARTAGWLAHAAEEYAERPLRFRPRASYVGIDPNG
jgi:citrate synthase